LPVVVPSPCTSGRKDPGREAARTIFFLARRGEGRKSLPSTMRSTSEDTRFGQLSICPGEEKKEEKKKKTQPLSFPSHDKGKKKTKFARATWGLDPFVFTPAEKRGEKKEKIGACAVASCSAPKKAREQKANTQRETTPPLQRRGGKGSSLLFFCHLTIRGKEKKADCAWREVLCLERGKSADIRTATFRRRVKKKRG